jgi:L-threonylcarbamoyladenylate synthase
MPVLPANEQNLARAAEVLRAGGLIGMPTETVYGLAADATSEAAVAKVFVAKGRPAENPLIVHIADQDTLKKVAASLPEYAAKLVARFWPGPLTLVLPKTGLVPALVTGGLDTVAVRMPDHPVALALIRLTGLPLAAPSANRFMQLSPTRAENVDEGLAEFVLDGGACRVGVESTVVDCTGDRPRILRPGGVSRAEIEATLKMSLHGPTSGETEPGRRSPGQYRRHYSPNTPLALVEELRESDAGLTLSKPLNPNQILMPKDARAYGAQLYAALHTLDGRRLERILVQTPPAEPEWEAVLDRLRRACGSGE